MSGAEEFLNTLKISARSAFQEVFVVTEFTETISLLAQGLLGNTRLGPRVH